MTFKPKTIEKSPLDVKSPKFYLKSPKFGLFKNDFGLFKKLKKFIGNLKSPKKNDKKYNF